MSRTLFMVLIVSISILSIAVTSPLAEETKKEPVVQKTTDQPDQVQIVTSLGDIVIELYPDKAPISVKNFLDYVDEGFYVGTVFHRVIKNFMVQGGGFDSAMVQKKTHPPIKNEASNGLKNLRGTVAYARTSIVDSATSQFFINVIDNAFLDHRDTTDQGYGYCVFGKVITGLDVVDKIQNSRTTKKNGMADVPEKPIVITSMKRLEKKN